MGVGADPIRRRPQRRHQRCGHRHRGAHGRAGISGRQLDTQLADLSVEHADVLQHYRAAHEIATAAGAGDADTEALRRAMVHYRALFASLLEDHHEQTEEDRPVTSRRTR
jgi:hypothetical protein